MSGHHESHDLSQNRSDFLPSTWYQRVVRWWLLLALASCAAPIPPPHEGTPTPAQPALTATPPPPTPPPPPSAPPCPAHEDAPLSDEALAEAVAAPLEETIAAALGVTCPPDAPNHRAEVAQAVARFQRRFGRFADEITGVVDARTKRTLGMIHPALRPPDHPCGATDEVPLPPCLLRWEGATAEQRAFMHRVYRIARERAAKRRDFVLAADEVAIIERGPCPEAPEDREEGCARTSWAQRDAAASARRLLTAARAHFDADRQTHGLRDLMVVTGYRSATFQLEIWEYHFPNRYRATARARARARGGPHGEAAALLLAQHFAARTAAPGFSLHGRGLALDFGCVRRDGRFVGSTGRFANTWKRTHCFRWLEAHASRYGFRLNPNIDEPWHWEWHPELVRE